MGEDGLRFDGDQCREGKGGVGGIMCEAAARQWVSVVTL